MFQITFGQMWRYKAPMFLKLYSFAGCLSPILTCYSKSDDVYLRVSEHGRQAPICTIEVVAGMVIATLPVGARIRC